MPCQWPSEAENIAWEALPFMHAALHVRCWVFSFLKEHGSHMEVADKTDVMLFGNFPNVCQGHTLVNGNAVCTAACHLTDDSDALSSRPQARCFVGMADDLPRRLQIRKHILPEIGGLQHRGGCIIDGNDVTADHLGIDTSRDGAHLTRIGEQRRRTLGMAEEVGEQGQAPKLVSNRTGTSRYPHKRNVAPL